jgi:hypothetical protein
MLISGKTICALRNKNKYYSDSCVVLKNVFWTKQKTITPPSS